jgi:hypothetical protein
MSIVNATLTNSTATAVYTSTGNSAVTTMYLCNKTATTATINVFVVCSGFQANGINIVYSNLSIAGNDTYIIESERILFNNGDLIAANASADSAVVVTTSFTGI